MAKKGKPESHWRQICNRLAKGEVILGKGWKPGRGEWLDKVVQIEACPETKRLKRGGTNQSTLSFAPASTAAAPASTAAARKCTCNWDHVQSESAASASAGTEQETQQPKEKITIPLGIPGQPEPRRTISDVRNKYHVYESKGCYNLEVFGYTGGKCPHCKGPPKDTGRVGGVKMVVTCSGQPRFLQGIHLKCGRCDNPGWQSIEKTYVDTLPLWQQRKLNAIIVGRATGVSMDLIRMMRTGITAASIERTCRSNLECWHAALEDEYNEKCEAQRQLGNDVVNQVFPRPDDKYVAKAQIVIRAFLRDYISVRIALLREQASLKSQHAVAIDHQHKVVQRAKGNAKYSFAIVGDNGIVLGYYAVPDCSLSWIATAMKEIVARHGAQLDAAGIKCITQGDLPTTIFVDTQCCNGKEGERTDEEAYLYGMKKKLDTFHLIQRIGKEINGEHPRKATFLQLLSECTFTSVVEDVEALNKAREQGNVGVLSHKEKKADEMKYVRQVVENPTLIVSKILAVVKGQVALDRQAKRAYMLSGASCEDITTSHPAYPLITKKVLKSSMNQCIHILNGCVHDEQPMNLHVGTEHYRNTFVALDCYKSLRGTSKVEALHSVLDRKVYASTSMRNLLFDAHLHWHITNYNRERLRSLGRTDVLPDGVSPSEVVPARVSIVKRTPLLFGFGYYDQVLREFNEHVEDEVLEELERKILNNLDCDDEDFLSDLEDEEEEDEDDADNDNNDEEEVEVSYNADDVAHLTMPLLTADIPASVDFASLQRIGGTLTEDVGVNASHNPFANTAPVEDRELNRVIKSHTTFMECLHNSNCIAANAGINIDEHDFGSVDMDQFNAAKNASPRRNVQTRTQRSQDKVPAPVDLNTEMEAKFMDLWARKANPSSGVGTKQWIHWAMLEYEKWRNEKITTDTVTPPLLPVTYNAILDWVTKMKATSSAPLRDGAFNATSSQLSSQLKALASTSSPLKDTPMGVAVDSTNLGVKVAIAFRGTSAGDLFESPTSRNVQEVMPRPQKRSDNNNNNECKPRAKRKRNDDPEAIAEELARKVTARRNMASFGITEDSADSRKRRCGICQKYRTFVFHGLKHLATKGLNFCPLADDPALYDNYKATCAQKKKEVNQQYYASKNN